MTKEPDFPDEIAVTIEYGALTGHVNTAAAMSDKENMKPVLVARYALVDVEKVQNVVQVMAKVRGK